MGRVENHPRDAAYRGFLRGRFEGSAAVLLAGPFENPLREDKSGGPDIIPAYFMNFGVEFFGFSTC